MFFRVLRIVEPGFSRNTAKTIFEKTDTWMFLSCDDFRWVLCRYLSFFKCKHIHKKSVCSRRGKISQKELRKRLAECKAEAEEAQVKNYPMDSIHTIKDWQLKYSISILF